jgi:hypothetical protein
MRNSLFGFVAPLCAALLFVSPVTAANRSEGRLPRLADESVDLFDAMHAGDVEVKVVARDASGGKALIKNKTTRPLSIRLPEAFAAVPVAAQIGGNPLGMNFGNVGANPFANGGGMNPGGIAGTGANQALGGAFPGMQGMNPQGNLGMGMNRLGGNVGVPGIFKVEPEKVAKLKITTVCLEHGKAEPNVKIAYQLKPLNDVVRDPKTAEMVKLFASGDIDQRSAQAAAWHLANGLSWQELQAKIGARHFNGQVEGYFSSEQLQRAQSLVAAAEQKALESKVQTDFAEPSLAKSKQ